MTGERTRNYVTPYSPSPLVAQNHTNSYIRIKETPGLALRFGGLFIFEEEELPRNHPIKKKI
jgi:hypothetical protein